MSSDFLLLSRENSKPSNNQSDPGELRHQNGISFRVAEDLRAQESQRIVCLSFAPISKTPLP